MRPIIIILTLTALLALPAAIQARTNSKFMEIINKIRKDQNTQTYYSPTAVAGVRGSDVDKKDKAQLRRELYWEE